MNSNSYNSFTLIEILIVITIVGVLAGIIIVSTSSAIEKAAIAKSQSFSSSINHVLMNSAISSYNFDNIPDGRLGTVVEASDADVKDQWSDNQVYGVDGSPTIRGGSNCMIGKCIEFSGGISSTYPCSGDAVAITDNNYPSGDTPITLEAWVRLKQGNPTNQIVFLGEDWFIPSGIGMYQDKFLFAFYGEVEYEVFNYSKKNPSSTIDTWTHVVGSYGSHRAKICINGNCETSTTISYPQVGKNGYFIIGAGAYQYYQLKGFIDGVRIYGQVLENSQIKSNYIAGLKKLLIANGITKIEYDKRLAEINKNIAENE